jgi:acyl-CoA hydrolase
MDPQTLYHQKRISIPEAVTLVQSHQTIGVAMAGSEPPGLLAELGRHGGRLEDVTEMFTDGMVDLYEAGVVTNRRKTLWQGKMVGAFALGTQKLYDFIDNNIGVEFQQGRITNDPAVIGRNHKMVSVNTALQVDIFGQVCSQSIGSRHFSGTGGQLDTHRGAQLSPGGRGIIALRSTAKDGAISTIVPVLDQGAEITVPSQDVDTIVTENGIASLRGLCVRDRLEALAQIAHPDFRNWLREEANRLGIVPRKVFQGV